MMWEMSRLFPPLLIVLAVLITGCGSPAVTPEPPVITPPLVVEPAPQPAPMPQPAEPEVLTPAQAYQAALVPVVPAGSLDTAIQAARRHELRVMFVGDSITEGGDVPTALTWANLARADLEARGVTTYNYALGQRNSDALLRAEYLGAAREPGNWTAAFGPRVPGDRPWVQVGKTWFDQVTFAGDPARAPNLYVVAFGINDAFEPGAFAGRIGTIVRRLRALPGQPSVVVVTPEVPSTTAQGGNAPLPATAVQRIAQATRDVAQEDGAALVDANRVWRVLVEGVDPVSGAVTTPTYTEGDLLGQWPGGYDADGNGYNHPSRLGHLVTYYAAMRELLAKLPTP